MCVTKPFSLRSYLHPPIMINCYALGFNKQNTSPRYNRAQKSYEVWLHFAQNQNTLRISIAAMRERERERERGILKLQNDFERDRRREHLYVLNWSALTYKQCQFSCFNVCLLTDSC
jgi:hypothetical protein